MKKNIIIYVLSIIIMLLLLLVFNDNKSSDIDIQFIGNWRIVDIMPVEISIPSVYSGFDENGNFRSQDLIDNIIGQKIFFGVDYIENQGKIYKLAENYVIHIIPILSEDMVIGSISAKNLGITGEYFYKIFFSILPGENSDFRNLNQLYLKDKNTIYASINGFLTFKLERIEE